MPEQFRKTHNRYQRDYFEGTERSRIALGETPYILAHVDHMVETAALSPNHIILEVGSGLGKFTLPLAARGYQVTANDLSPLLLERLDIAAQGRVPTVCCDIHDIAHHVQAPVDRIIGFFVLHHLVDFDQVFQSLAKVLRPGGRIAFCEPVALNPLYYLQILLTPGMRFAGEPSITAMRPGIILPALAQAGFVEAACHPYGYFPPFIKNRAWGDCLERWLDQCGCVPFPHAFQIFTARLPE
jgi:SAM-dependent methyltransferase